MEESEPDEPPSRPPQRLQDSSVSYRQIRTESQSSGSALNTSRCNGTGGLRSAWDSPKRWLASAASLVCSSSISVLLVFVPVSMAVGFAKLDPIFVFTANALAIIPLAIVISASTEKVANRFGDTISALLNVSVGNTAELMIFFVALAKDQIQIVQASLLGSVLANLLLVLGTACLYGGLRYGSRLRDRVTGRVSIALLGLGLLAAVLPVSSTQTSIVTIETTDRLVDYLVWCSNVDEYTRC